MWRLGEIAVVHHGLAGGDRLRRISILCRPPGSSARLARPPLRLDDFHASLVFGKIVGCSFGRLYRIFRPGAVMIHSFST
jgi:hypothetical protein